MNKKKCITLRTTRQLVLGRAFLTPFRVNVSICVNIHRIFTLYEGHVEVKIYQIVLQRCRELQSHEKDALLFVLFHRHGYYIF